MENKEKKENKSKKRSLIGYYSVVAFSLAIIGSVSWFAATKTDNIGKSNGKKEEEYHSIAGSYTNTNDNEQTSDEAKAAEKEVTDEPYESDSEKTETEKKQGFVMPVEGEVIKPYSNSELQYSKTYADMRLHEGVDIKCEKGSVVKAAYDGTVTDILDDKLYGKTVVINHGNGISVRYYGLDNIAVTKGAAVKAGDQIAFVGIVPSEIADPSHIHIDAILEDESISILELLSKTE